MIMYFEAEREQTSALNEGYIAPLGLILSSIIKILVTHWEFNGMTVTGMRIRVSLCSVIYQKVNDQTT